MRRRQAAWIPAVLALGLVATACGGGGNPLVFTENPPTEMCDDGMDNDDDGLIDCDDPDCVDHPACAMLVAMFSADPASRSPRISMDPGPATNDEVFFIEIRASGVPDLYGVAFTVMYNKDKANFVSCNADGSILAPGNTNPCDDTLVGGAKFFAVLENGDQGLLNVRASLDGLVEGIDLDTGLLLTLMFEAIDTTSTPESFSFEEKLLVECCPGGDPLPQCGCPEEPSFDGGTLLVTSDG